MCSIDREEVWKNPITINNNSIRKVEIQGLE